MEKYKEKKLTHTRFNKEIIKFAQYYQATEFPNPKREGCPPKDILLKIFALKTLPDKSLQQHLLTCSQCFQLISKRPFINDDKAVKNQEEPKAKQLNSKKKGVRKHTITALYPLEQTSIDISLLDNAVVSVIGKRTKKR